MILCWAYSSIDLSLVALSNLETTLSRTPPIYTTNAIESLNMTLRKVIKNHRAFPTDESAFKVVYLAMNNIAQKWTMPISNWKPALNRFAILYEERFPL
jgi:putative transposase